MFLTKSTNLQFWAVNRFKLHSAAERCCFAIRMPFFCVTFKEEQIRRHQRKILALHAVLEDSLILDRIFKREKKITLNKSVIQTYVFQKINFSFVL